MFDKTGYKWNAYTLELASEEDRNKFYSFINKVGYKYDKEQHKLTKQTFKPLDKVLVKNDTNEKWSINLFSYYDEENKIFPYVCNIIIVFLMKEMNIL